MVSVNLPIQSAMLVALGYDPRSEQLVRAQRNIVDLWSIWKVEGKSFAA
jgi:hypothetical protein